MTYGVGNQNRCVDISEKQTHFSFCSLNLSPFALLSEKEGQMNIQSYVLSYKIVGSSSIVTHSTLK